ncbi:MAG: F0F1 ATP synthase subunit B' [Rhodospirillaceae bacterium]|nr:F0F1 ATP synthase subunit B' [Rhodospirillaceae bacterium]
MRVLNKALISGLVGTTTYLTAAVAMAADGGLPQLDVSTYSSQVVWLVISFVALYVLMSTVALPRIGEVLEERQNKIDDNLAKAEDLKAQAEAAASAYEQSLANARSQAADAIREVKEKASTEAHNRQAKLTAQLSESIKQAESSINKAKLEALSGIKAVAVDVATAAVSKLINEPANENAVSSAVSTALKSRT